MLLDQQTLSAIERGEISLVFRRWKRPTVKTGGTLKTSVGVLAIHHVEVIDPKTITDRQAHNAGYHSATELRTDLESRSGDVYRIEVALLGADPRIALRESDTLTTEEVTEIANHLKRLDARSSLGPWTYAVLSSIDQHPHLAAIELASLTGYEKDWLKVNVRKLKNLGLTISHHPGYEVSPRGKRVLAFLASP